LHRKKRIGGICDVCDTHTGAIMRDTLPDGEWVMIGFLDDELSSIDGENSILVRDDSGEHGIVRR